MTMSEHANGGHTIVRNAAECLVCGEVVESKNRHDFKCCMCGAVCVDGGLDYLRRVGNPGDCVERSEYGGAS